MFDKYVLSTSPTHTTSTEHRAPTDDSVRILQEMQDKAERALVVRYLSDRDNIVEGLVATYERDLRGLDIWCCVAFKLNGEDIIARERIDRATAASLRSDDYARMLIDKLAQRIALALVATRGIL